MGNYIRTQNAIYNINDLIEKTSKEYVNRLQDEQFCIKNDEKYKFFKEWLKNE